MNDQEIVMNTLISLKHLIAFFSTFATEAGSKPVEKVVDKAYKDLLQAQRDVFTLMCDEGFMKVQYQTVSAIKKEYKKFEKKSIA